MPISHILWRVTEGKGFPLQVRLLGRCRRCGATIDVQVPIWTMAEKPDRLRCCVCACGDVRVMSARAEPLEV